MPWPCPPPMPRRDSLPPPPPPAAAEKALRGKELSISASVSTFNLGRKRKGKGKKKHHRPSTGVDITVIPSPLNPKISTLTHGGWESSGFLGR
ncbi:hypothetical protein OPV22_021459 [Ensete ventricosum]|uniref:Uncharacterized protein n=1 Tax=Ensete ventricosum TaxID=4639 RepID=A0AAV8QH58_ENSVE|nr:hypothetical protein OPV22_021459 [Ensete ventricosum]